MLPAKCASSDSYVPPPMGAVGDTFEDRDPQVCWLSSYIEIELIRFDSKRIVSGAYDGKIKVWDLQAAMDPRFEF